MLSDSWRDTDKLGQVKADTKGPDRLPQSIRVGRPAGRLLAESTVAGVDPVPLDWLPYVVQRCARTRPDKVALQHLVDLLSGHAGLALYELRREDWARPVTDALVWRAARKECPARYAWVDNRANPDGSLKVAGVLGWEPETVRRHVPAQTAQTELRGVPGALALMRELVGSGQSVANLLRCDVFKLAVRSSDAAALLDGGTRQPGVTAGTGTRPMAPVVRLVKCQPMPSDEAGAVDDIAQHANESLATATPPAWKDGQGQWLPATLDAWRKLRANGVSDAKIAGQYGVTRGVITGKLGTKTANKVASQGHKVSTKAAW